jgi:hypothetical protein
VGRRRLRRPAPTSAAVGDEDGQGEVVYLPEWLLQTIDATCPHEDRTPERKVFQGITEASAYQGMLRACQGAGTALIDA